MWTHPERAGLLTDTLLCIVPFSHCIWICSSLPQRTAFTSLREHTEQASEGQSPAPQDRRYRSMCPPWRVAGSVMLVKKQLKELSKQMINNVVGVGVMKLLRKTGP